jgi:hypothetical protein
MQMLVKQLKIIIGTYLGIIFTIKTSYNSDTKVFVKLL